MVESWFVEFRLAWIKEIIEIFGYINREHIMRKFQISTIQASIDISKALERWPDLMAYNRSSKRYEVTDTNSLISIKPNSENFSGK